MLLSIVVPVFREEKNIPEFLRRIRPILGAITEDYEIIFSMDPSPDRTEEVVLEERLTDPRIKLLKFSRRFGQPMATLAGMEYSRGDAVIVMDVDLQDPPELIHDMVNKWQQGYDVVLPQRRARTGEPWLKKLVAGTGYKVINKIADVKIPQNTGDFRLMTRRVILEVVKLKESHGFLRGMVAVVGFKQCIIPFDRPARFAGETNYNRFFGSLRIGFNGIFCFSTYALTLSTQFGFVIAAASFLIAMTYLGMKLAGFPFPIGNPTMVILILFMGGIYEEVRARPKFIVDRAEGFKS
jgi:glycosyltransferase involved in cell wall biosynthesis